MTTPAENYDGPPRYPATKDDPTGNAVWLGAAGMVIGIGGYLAVMLLSKDTGWWSAPYIASLLACGLVAAILGIRATVKSGRLSRLKILARILGITSTVVGIVIVGVVGSFLLLMLMLSASRW